MGGIKVQVRPTVGTRSASNKVRNSNKQEHLEKVWVEVNEQPEIHNFVARLGLQRPLDAARSTFIQYNKLFIKKQFQKRISDQTSLYDAQFVEADPDALGSKLWKSKSAKETRHFLA